MRWVRTDSAVALACVFGAAQLWAQGQSLVPPPARDGGAVLVELFTSEGCSDCPPADKLLAEIDGKLTHGNELIVGISEHVTYWNQLGWEDPFSRQSFTDRQNAYGERFQLQSVYTPQMVVNGETQFVGNDAFGLRKILDAKRAASPVTMRIVSVTAKGKSWEVAFAVGGEIPAHGADIYAVIADDMRSSHVPSGENAGRVLTHMAVGRDIALVATVKRQGTVTVTVPSPGAGKDSGPSHLVLFAQTAGLGRVLAVSTQALK